MAVLVSRNQRSYTPQTVSLPFTVSAGVRMVMVTLTRPSWPAGVVIRGRVVWANGEETQAEFIGDGTLPAKVGTGVPTGVTSGTAFVEVLQNVTTAITVESF